PSYCYDGINKPLKIDVISAETSGPGCTSWTIRLGVGDGVDDHYDYRTICPDTPDVDTWYEREISIYPKYDYSLNTQLYANGNIGVAAGGSASHVVADWSKSVTIYVDDPGSVAVGGYDFSDPARRKTQIIVKNSAPLSPDHGYKIVGGGAQSGS